MTDISTTTTLSVPKGSLPIPHGLQTNTISNWIDYGLWGLVLYDDQSPWMTLIECMHILFYRHSTVTEELFSPPQQTNFLGKVDHEVINYEVPVNINLRHLLFRDQDIMGVVGNYSGRKDEQWTTLIERTKKIWDIDLSYLPDAFEDVTSLGRALDLLRSTAVDPFASRRWTSKHLLPLGPDMIFADVGDRGLQSDRRFMRRTGEILYLMLGRSKKSHRQRVSQLLRDRLLARSSAWNDLARMMRPKGGDRAVRLATAYLPFARLDVYDNLAEDWIALLSLGRMEIDDLLDPLMRISTLHQIIYILQRCQATIGIDASRFPPFVLDLLGSARKNPVQRISVGQYGSHVKLPRRAIEAHIDSVSDLPEWREIADSRAEVGRARKTLRRMFLWPGEKHSNATGVESAAKLLDSFRSVSLSRRSHSMWSFISSHAREAGLVVSRGGAGTWYAPTDTFLEALVLANVQSPTEFGKFLRKLYERYRIVIGQEQAQEAFGRNAMSLERLKQNEHRLEDRLRVLRFIDRKSDACAFVVNPFYESGQAQDKYAT